MSRIRLIPMILIVLLCLGILFGGWQAYKRFNMVEPLKTQLATVPGVKNVEVNVGNPSSIKVKLGAVDDLQTTYKAIETKVSGSLGSSQSVQIVDNRNQTLGKAWEDLSPIVYEYGKKGNYTEMIAAVEKSAAAKGIQATVTMDTHNVYIQLAQGSHDLYDVWPYTLNQGGATS